MRDARKWIRCIILICCALMIRSAILGAAKKQVKDQLDAESKAQIEEESVEFSDWQEQKEYSDVASESNNQFHESVNTSSTIRIEAVEDGADSDAVDYENKKSFLLDTVYEYAYQQLNSYQQEWYCQLRDGIGVMDPEIKLSKEGVKNGLNEDDVSLVFQSVMIDHPEFFYLDGYKVIRVLWNDKLSSLEVDAHYLLTKKEALKRKEQIDKVCMNVLSGISTKASDYEKAKYVYEYIIKSTEYDLSSSDNQNIYSVLVNRASVCQGYAKAYQYLLLRLGMQCTLVEGKVDNNGHAWNVLKVDDDFYYVDCTFGDSSYSNINGMSSALYIPDINYDYLCISKFELEKTHEIKSILTLPNCSSLKANYYVMEGAYFDHFDSDELHAFFENKLETEEPIIGFKCSSDILFQQLERLFFEEQEIFSYFPEGTQNLSYIADENHLTMTFWMTN